MPLLRLPIEYISPIMRFPPFGLRDGYLPCWRLPKRRGERDTAHDDPAPPPHTLHTEVVEVQAGRPTTTRRRVQARVAGRKLRRALRRCLARRHVAGYSSAREESPTGNCSVRSYRRYQCDLSNVAKSVYAPYQQETARMSLSTLDRW